MPSPKELFDRQIALLEARDLDGLLAQYHEDAVLLRFDRVVTGKAELKEFFAGYVALAPRVERIERFAESDDLLAYEAIVSTETGEMHTYGVFLLRDGKIWRQTAAAFS